MSRGHTIATGMIDSRFERLEAGDTSSQLHSEVSMGYAMAQALGVISESEYRGYTARHDRIIQAQHEDLMAKLRRLSA